MKTIILTLTFILTINISLPAQQWIQTGGIPDGAGITDIVITPNETIIVTTASFSSVAGTLGGVRRSTNDGDSWENPLDGFNGRTLHLGDNGVLFASFWPFPLEEAIYRSTNDGVNWTRLHYVSTGDNIFSITSKDNNNMIFIGTRNGVKRSTNAGVNWSYVNNGIPANSWVRDMETDTSNGIVIAATTNGVFTTTNDGASWEMATGISTQDTIVKIGIDYAIETDNNDNNRVYYGSNSGSIYTSLAQSRYLTCTLLLIFQDEEVSGLANSVLRSENEKWYGVSTFPEMGNLNENGGFYLSRDGSTFNQENNGLPNSTKPSALVSRVTTMRGETSEVTFFLGSFENTIDGAKVYKLTYLVSIQQISSELPVGFKLKQNYPNPFNPSTNIKFDILGKETVRLSVFNSLGQEVAVLVDQKLSAGSYEYKFDAGGLSSGIYFCKLQTENFSETKKMLLVK